MTISRIVKEDIEHIHAGLPRARFAEATILVTGCAGFLGYYFLQYFTRKAFELDLKRVIALDTFLLHRPHWLTDLTAEFPNVLETRTFNIASDDLRSVDGAHAADHVIHLASIASPTFYRRYPVETIDANIWGLRRLLEFYRDSNRLKGLLFFSSSEIYGDPTETAIPTDEEYRGNVACFGPRACYDESKRFGEMMCYVFSKAYGMPITVARPFNNYGPGMRIDDCRLPADFARCVIDQRDIVILSDGSPTRTFCYISDAIRGYLLCLLHGKYDYFNIGIDRPEISVHGLAEIYQQAALDLFGLRSTVVFERSSDAEYLVDNPNRRCPVIKKARDILGYAPKVLVNEGVRRYLSFLRDEFAA
ncbi:NAD-dependent epimerase/dehydratase family protein [Bradyrhizobium sp. ISRA443]|uniref:NAD-dependent epimerase/dehydratase family protein n=1 Tax=unclassified Bradyrhizobium TaxID=2631580 RepID=UPI002478D40C|nr:MULTISPECIES: NAD-dependent epimerase/dehydratase family protein [unclassified Bradyrhizobium]WGR97906.1 NAD-dependent epimerase/dehydratase family protein [Bradyrhizobium sp. ISRA436]WGS04796.1 NAD-dependent epimerase/dehydratase family protein [Bradyrhizobium sp. ISRA437]WGS11677.1 NAD-dependent epimerase/dehydratase family protein [Bradyrhizobium sp. ISRA443]